MITVSSVYIEMVLASFPILLTVNKNNHKLYRMIPVH